MTWCLLVERCFLSFGFIERMLCCGAGRRVGCDKRHYDVASMCVHKAAFKNSFDEMRGRPFITPLSTAVFSGKIRRKVIELQAVVGAVFICCGLGLFPRQ